MVTETRSKSRERSAGDGAGATQDQDQPQEPEREAKSEPENEYSDDEFEYDEVIETEAYIQYNASIGPNIIVSKVNSNSNKKTPRPRFTTTTATKKIFSQRSRSIRPKTLMGTPLSNRRTQTFVKRTGKSTSLKNQFQKLSLDVDVVFPGSRSGGSRSVNTPGVHFARGSKSNLAIAEAKPSIVQQRLNSAKKIQMKDMMSKLHLLETTIHDLRAENRSLKTIHHRQDIALRKYEGVESDFPRLLEQHTNEVQALQRGLRKAHSTARENEDKMRTLNHKIFCLEKENARLNVLVRLNELDERQKLVKQVQQMENQLTESEKKGTEFKRRYELLDKNQNKQLGGIHGKLRASNNRLFAAEQEIDRQSDLLRQKDKVINYLRMRGSRYIAGHEPPIMRKMSEVAISKYKPFHKTCREQQLYMDCDEPHNPASRSQYPPHRTHIPKMQFSIRRIYRDKRVKEEIPPHMKPITESGDVQSDEEENYSIAGSGPSDVRSVSSCGSRMDLETGGRCELDVSRGSMSPSYSEENLETWGRRGHIMYPEHRGRGDESFTELEGSDVFEDPDLSKGYLGYKGRIQTRAYSAIDINTLRGCDSELVIAKKGGGVGRVYERIPRGIEIREHRDANVDVQEAEDRMYEQIPRVRQEKQDRDDIAQEQEEEIQIQHEDVPREGTACSEPEDLKPIETCPMDGGGDTLSCSESSDACGTALDSGPEYGFFPQTATADENETRESVSRDVSTSESSIYGFVEEDLESDAKAYEKEREIFTPMAPATAMNETDDEDDKVMHRILEAVLERSEKVEQQARINVPFPYQVVHDTSYSGLQPQASTSGSGKSSQTQDQSSATPNRTIEPSSRTSIHFPENSTLERLTNSANVAKSRAFALSSPFYTFSNKLSQLDESEKASDIKFSVMSSATSSFSKQRAEAAAESSASPVSTAEPTEQDSSTRPRLPSSKRPDIIQMDDDDDDTYSFRSSQMELRKFENTLNSFYKTIKSPSRKPLPLLSSTDTEDTWSLAAILKSDSDSSASKLTDTEDKPGTSSSSRPVNTRNGILKYMKGVANTPAGNVSPTKNSTQPTRRFKSNWE